MATNHIPSQEPPEEYKPQPKVKEKTSRLIAFITGIFIFLSLVLYVDTFSKLFVVGVDFLPIVILVIELVLGVTLTAKAFRQKLFGKFAQVADTWGAVVLTVLLFCIMFVLTLYVFPFISTLAYQQGKIQLADERNTLGTWWLQQSLYLQPGPIVTLIPVMMQVNPHLPILSAIHYDLGTIKEGINDKAATFHYQQAIEADECYVYSYWRLSQVQLGANEYSNAHTTLENAIRILNGSGKTHCQSRITEFDLNELKFWVYLTNARIFIEEGKSAQALVPLTTVESSLPDYRNIQNWQYVTYYFWWIKASQDINDCVKIQKSWDEMQPYFQAISNPSHITNDRYIESKGIYESC